MKRRRLESPALFVFFFNRNEEHSEDLTFFFQTSFCCVKHVDVIISYESINRLGQMA